MREEGRSVELNERERVRERENEERKKSPVHSLAKSAAVMVCFPPANCLNSTCRGALGGSD